jgi:hypothetical protein
MSGTRLREDGPKYLDVDGIRWITAPPVIDSSSLTNRRQAVDDFILALPVDYDCKAIKSIARNMKNSGGKVFEYIFRGPVALINVKTDGDSPVILNLVANPNTKGGGVTLIEYVLSHVSLNDSIEAERIAEDAMGFYQRLGFKITNDYGKLDARKSNCWAKAGGTWRYTSRQPILGNTIGDLFPSRETA